jgi:hypothetical protein
MRGWRSAGVDSAGNLRLSFASSHFRFKARPPTRIPLQEGVEQQLRNVRWRLRDETHKKEVERKDEGYRYVGLESRANKKGEGEAEGEGEAA